MNKRSKPLVGVLTLALLGAVSLSFPSASWAQSTTTSTAQQTDLKPGILDREHAAAIFPTSVFYNGQSAPVQGRNSAGIRFPGGKLALVALVDTSGYSSAIQQSYQGYLLNETTLTLGDKTLAPGAYGFGFVAGNRVVVMDIGGKQLLQATTIRDESMTRPNPLQILPEASVPGHYRLYLGRSYVILSADSSTAK